MEARFALVYFIKSVPVPVKSDILKWRILDGWKSEFWDAVHIGIPFQDQESNDAIVLGFLVAWFLQEV